MKLTTIILSALLLLCANMANASVDFYENGLAISILSETERLCALEQNEGYPYSGDLILPDSITHNGTAYRLYQINSYAFYSCSNLKSLTIPPSVRSVNKYVFSSCSSLKNLLFKTLKSHCHF